MACELITAEGCCSRLNPCEAVCALENMSLQLALGKKMTSHKIGDETFNIKLPSIAELQTLILHFEKLCNKRQGKPTRRRAKICIVHGENTCGQCGSISNCRCR